jgi:hypothetical protein
MLERGEDAGLGMEAYKVETPAAVLTFTLLAREAVEPPFKPARKFEIAAVNREHERVIDDAA